MMSSTSGGTVADNGLDYSDYIRPPPAALRKTPPAVGFPVKARRIKRHCGGTPIGYNVAPASSGAGTNTTGTNQGDTA